MIHFRARRPRWPAASAAALLLGGLLLAACRGPLPGPTQAASLATATTAATATAEATAVRDATPTATQPPADTHTPAPSPTAADTAATTSAPPAANTATATAVSTATATELPPPGTPTPCADAWFMSNPPAACPAGPPAMAVTIAQHFERGLLVWRAQPDVFGSQIYAFFEDGQWPAWNPTNDRWRPGLPESDPSIVPPAGFYQPVRGFGMFWREANFVPAGTARDRLGWATGEEFSLGERAMQCVAGSSRMAGCFIEGPAGRIYVIEGNNAWAIWAGPP
jgi:hypothetical protein